MGNKKCDCKKSTIGNVSSTCSIHGIGYFDSYWKKLITAKRHIWQDQGEINPNRFKDYLLAKGWTLKNGFWKAPSSWADDK